MNRRIACLLKIAYDYNSKDSQNQTNPICSAELFFEHKYTNNSGACDKAKVEDGEENTAIENGERGEKKIG